MLSKEERKEVVRKFKERKPLLGVFAVRCTATGLVWVGASRNLDATRNGCLSPKLNPWQTLPENVRCRSTFFAGLR